MRDKTEKLSSGGRGGNASAIGNRSKATGGRGGAGGPGGRGGDGGDAFVEGDDAFAMGGEGGEAGQADRGGRGGRSPLEILSEIPDERGKKLKMLLDIEQLQDEYKTVHGYPAPDDWITSKIQDLGYRFSYQTVEGGHKLSPLQGSDAQSSSSYSNSDQLAIALTCLTVVGAIALFLAEKTPITVLLLIIFMLAFAIYPILHFTRRIVTRTLAFLLVFLIAGASGWQGLKSGKTPVNKEASAAPTGDSTQPKAEPEIKPLPTAKPLPPPSLLRGQQRGPIIADEKSTPVSNTKRAHGTGENETLRNNRTDAVALTAKGRDDNGSLGVLTQGPGSIAQIGGSGNQAQIINQEVPASVTAWRISSAPFDPNATHSRVSVDVQIDHRFDMPIFAVLCDRPCKAIGATTTSEGYQQGSSGTVGRADVAAFRIISPDPMPAMAHAILVVESSDDRPVEVLDVKTLRVPKENIH